MKSEKGVTLTSLIVYVIAMVITVATVGKLTSFFYGNVDKMNTIAQGAKEYTAFNSYFTNEINQKENHILTEISSNTKLIFSNGNQYTYINNAIYFNKILICREVSRCEFNYDSTRKQVGVSLTLAGENFSNVYKLNI